MLIFNMEQLQQVLPELDPLLRDQWDEMQTVEGLKFSPNYMLYIYLETINQALLMTARDEGKLVGFLGVLLKQHPHAQETLNAYEETFYLKPEYRKSGAGRKMIKFMLAALQSQRVHSFYIHENDTIPTGKLYKSMGFKPKFTIYVRTVGDL